MRSVAESCMHNRANTLAMLACLEVCREQKPYRNAEAEIDALPVMDMTTQNAHALIKALVEAGGIIRIDVPENESENLAVCAGEESADSNEQDPSAKPQDQPTDYLLQTTEEGLLALDELSSE